MGDGPLLGVIFEEKVPFKTTKYLGDKSANESMNSFVKFLDFKRASHKKNSIISETALRN